MCHFARLPACGSCTPLNAFRLVKDNDAAFHISALLIYGAPAFRLDFPQTLVFRLNASFSPLHHPGASIRTKLELLD